jgi:hypothetical protein
VDDTASLGSLTPGPRADEVLKLALFPWVAAVVVAKVVPIVQAYEGSKAAKALQAKVERMMEEVMAGAKGHEVGVARGCAAVSNVSNAKANGIHTGLIAAMSTVSVEN